MKAKNRELMIPSKIGTVGKYMYAWVEIQSYSNYRSRTPGQKKHDFTLALWACATAITGKDLKKIITSFLNSRYSFSEIEIADNVLNLIIFLQSLHHATVCSYFYLAKSISLSYKHF